jgi:hypothetical protein
MNLKETGRGYVDWIHLAQDGVQWRPCCEYPNELLVSVRSGEYSE